MKLAAFPLPLKRNVGGTLGLEIETLVSISQATRAAAKLPTSSNRIPELVTRGKLILFAWMFWFGLSERSWQSPF